VTNIASLYQISQTIPQFARICTSGTFKMLMVNDCAFPPAFSQTQKAQGPAKTPPLRDMWAD
jgi:hypothetical protein